LPLDSLLLKHKSVLVPDEVWLLGVESVSLHAAFKQPYDISVIWVLGETEASAVVHELLELLWLVLAEFFNCNFLLLFLDGSILLSL